LVGDLQSDQIESLRITNYFGIFKGSLEKSLFQTIDLTYLEEGNYYISLKLINENVPILKQFYLKH
jgi:hypothetical protein